LRQNQEKDMKKFVFPAGLCLALLSSCFGGGSKIKDAMNELNHYSDSIRTADSIAEHGPATTINFSNYNDSTLHGKRVTIEGYFTLPTGSVTYGSSLSFDMFERRSQFPGSTDLNISVDIGTGNNTMDKLQDKYLAKDINIRGNKGEPIVIGDRVKVTGKYSVYGSYCSIDVQEIEKVEHVSTDYATIEATQLTADNMKDEKLEGKLVWVEGMIDYPYSTMDGTSTFMYVKAAGFDDNVTIDLQYGDQPGNLEPLPDNYSEADFKIHAADGSIINTKKKVRVIGVLKDEWIKVENVSNK
jgi:DNA/RNA endonuclease YhcR with UshA esterase domain